MQTMHVALDPQLADLVRRKVDDGLYPSAEAVVREALRLLDENDRLAYLRAALAKADAQIDRGEGIEWTPELMDELSREAHELFERGVQPNPDVCP